MSKDKAYLTTDEEIEKAIASLEEEGLLSKAEGSDGGEGGEGGEPGTNAKVEGEEEGEEGVDKGKKKPEGEEVNKGVEGDGGEWGDEIQKAIDVEPILKAFADRQASIEAKMEAKFDALIKAVQTMSGSSAVVFKGISERIAPIENLEKAVEEIHKFSTGRRTMGAQPFDRFEKGAGGGSETVVDIRTQGGHDAVLEVLEKALYDNRGNLKDTATEALVQDMKRFSVHPAYMSKGIIAECTKAGVLLKGIE